MTKQTGHAEFQNGHEISECLKIFISSCTTEYVTVEEVRDTLSSRVYGVLLLFFSVPLMVPIPTPGLSAVVSLPLLVLSFQLMLGLKSPWFPKFIAKKKM